MLCRFFPLNQNPTLKYFHRALCTYYGTQSHSDLKKDLLYSLRMLPLQAHCKKKKFCCFNLKK